MTAPDVAVPPAPPDLAPESPPQGPWVWMKANLFSSPFNSVITVVTIGVVASFMRGILGFIFDPSRDWSAVATNMRLYMTQAYPEEQYLRVWVSLGVVMALIGLSMAAWEVGGRISVERLAKTTQAAAGFLALLAMLGPPSETVETGIPIIGEVLDFILEALFLTGGRLAVFVVAALLFGAAYGVRRAFGPRAKDVTVPLLLVLLVLLIGVVIAVWTVPIGDYAFIEGQPVYTPGTVADTTKGPITVMAVVLVVAYLVGRAVRPLLPGRLMRVGLTIAWLLSLPTILLIILRDPDWRPEEVNGGFEFLPSADWKMGLFFLVVGSLVIYALSLPQLGEWARISGGILLLVALATFVIPDVMTALTLDVVDFELLRAKLLALLLAMFALGAPSFAGDRQSRIRYIGMWMGVVAVATYFLAVINTPSTLDVPGGSFLGGLTLTFVLALTSIFLSFPIGVLMALGRTSTMPIFRVVSTMYIELVRGIPFITVLIFFDLILVLFLPEGLELDSVMLAILAGTLFSAAYLAENVRGGLQSIPKGQYEAARAMGLSTLQLTVFIVMPQALRAVIPALVGQTIAIFKDTSLVAIIGLFDFLYIANNVIPNQTAFLGVRLENLLFIATVYWIFTFSFSRASLRLEKKLGLGER